MRKRRQPPPSPFPPFDELLRMLFGEISNPKVEVIEVPVEVIKEVSIPAPMFRKLMMLCHPDKHGNSSLSQEVTRWLLDQRVKK